MRRPLLPFRSRTLLFAHSSLILLAIPLFSGWHQEFCPFGERLESCLRLIWSFLLPLSHPSLVSAATKGYLDHLADLPRYVLPGHFQTTLDDKSGYQHVRLHPSSETYFGLEWKYFFLCVFRTLPFGWKASTCIYHNLGLVVSHAARSLGVMWVSFMRFYAPAQDKKTKFATLRESMLSSSCVSLKTLQSFAGKVVSFSLAIPG